MKPVRLLVAAILLLAAVGTLVWVSLRHRDMGARDGRQPDAPARQTDAARVTSVATPGTQAIEASSTSPVEEVCGPRSQRVLRELAAGKSLSRSDCEDLCRFVSAPTTDEKLERMASIKNDVMNILAAQPNLPADWDHLLARIYKDERQHPVIRDYALQHLFEYYEAASEHVETEAWEPDRRARIRDLFWEALDQNQQSFAGTALLALFRLSDLDYGIDRELLAQRTLESLADQSTGDLARITAFQVAAALEQPGAIPEATRVLADGPTVALKVSAAAALGALGGEAELALLRQFQDEANPSIRGAIHAAVKAIESRPRR
jgi:hypothetical protein